MLGCLQYKGCGTDMRSREERADEGSDDTVVGISEVDVEMVE